MHILGIESSCDETAASLIEATSDTIRVISSEVSSQIKIHRKYGGIVPEVAARNHVANILPVLQNALGKMHPSKLDAIAATSGPGLITSLMVGAEAAKILAYLYHIPLIPVNHLEGHIFVNVLSTKQKKISIPSSQDVGKKWKNPKQIQNLKLNASRFKFQDLSFRFPALALVVSGGHTQLVLMKKFGHFEVIGQTRDDAAGEAFDKVAKILSLGYPGGPIISKLAERGNPQSISFPRPMIQSKDFDFSFSGLKTAVLYLCQREDIVKMKDRPALKKETNSMHSNGAGIRKRKLCIEDTCASFEQSVTDVLVAKTLSAAKKFHVKTILLGGGVGANRRLRSELEDTVSRELPNASCLLPHPKFTTDNAVMIAIAGYYKYLFYQSHHPTKQTERGKDFQFKHWDWRNFSLDPNLRIAPWK